MHHLLSITQSSSLINIVFLGEQTSQFLSVKIAPFHFLPQKGSALIEADDLGEIDILYAVTYDDGLATDGS